MNSEELTIEKNKHFHCRYLVPKYFFKPVIDNRALLKDSPVCPESRYPSHNGIWLVGDGVS